MEESRAFENIHKWLPAEYECDGPYGIPAIMPVEDAPDVEKWIRFGDVKQKGCGAQTGVHFFEMDYRFERVWTHIDVYTPLAKRAGCILSPDFSLYTDLPVALQLYNHYRKHYVARYWQNRGATVVPTISWSDESSLKWCFDGEPEESVVAVSSLGCMRSGDGVRKLFMMGYDAMMERLRPSKILFFGRVPKECRGDIVRVELPSNNPNGRR